MTIEKKRIGCLYGPVSSRRLGRSLGVDLVPFKTCTYDCIYCQLGRTTHKTTARTEYVSVSDIIRELRQRLLQPAKPDYITISGSGEPTLHFGLGRLIAEIRELTDIPVAVLTNGSLLWDRDVRRACAQADLVLPSLDAGDEVLFRHVNRPHDDVTFATMVRGLMEFRQAYRGKIWLEVFLLGGITGIVSEVRKIKRYVDEISPDKIQVNTVARPPAEEFAFTIPEGTLKVLGQLLGEGAEVIAHPPPSCDASNFEARRADILTLLARRPCTIDDIATGLLAHQNEVVKVMEKLLAEGEVKGVYHGGALFYEPFRRIPVKVASRNESSVTLNSYASKVPTGEKSR